MLKFFRKLKAKKVGVPFSYSKFWPAGQRYVGSEDRDLQCIWQQSNIFEPPLLFGEKRPSKGDVVPVWFSNGFAHFYRIVGTGRLSGSDHTIDPTTYHIEYENSKPAQLSERSK